MGRTVETEVFQFEELSEEAQQVALAWGSDLNVDRDWWDFTYEDAKTSGIKLDGFDIYRRDISGEFIENAEDAATKIIENHGDSCDTYTTAQAYLAALTIINVKAALQQDNDDAQEALDQEREELDEEFKKDILDCYLTMLDKEYDYLCSEEAVKETIIANAYEFTADGERF